jgi:23S rRNA (adenine-N6)-dimethyltransferase
VAGRRARKARRSPAGSRHFIRSQRLAGEVVRDAGVCTGDLVLDLGAGTGRLTMPLAHSAGRVLAVELDPLLAALLRGRWPSVEIVEGDAASIPLPHAPFRVVANLPFDGTNAILRHLLDRPDVPLERADLVVEWGVAVKRALPWPSTAAGVLWGARYRFALARRLPASVFEPRPSVDAGVLTIERRAEPLVSLRDWEAYCAFVTRGFRHGRHGGSVPRELDAHQWAALFRRG